MPSQSNQKLKPRSTKSPPRTVVNAASRSLAKGLFIVESLVARQEPMTLRDISALAGLGKASALRLLRTLQATGYVGRNANDRYFASHSWPSTQQQQRLNTLRACAAPVLAKLNAELGETVALAFLFDDVIRVVEVLESTHHIRMSNYRGGILQPFASSLGKSIAACQPAASAQRLLHTYGIFALTPNTLTDFRAIQDELAAVRQRGFAWDLEETVPGGFCCGAPIVCRNGEVYSAISMSMPKARFTKRVEESLPRTMKKRAAEIARAIDRALAAG